MPSRKTAKKTVKRTVGKTVRKTVRKAVKKDVTKVILVGVMGRATENVALTKTTTAQDIASNMGISFARVEASKDATGENFKEIKNDDVVNGFKAIVFTPEVSGGLNK